jgi:AcrR family transcriptional regulator
MNKSTLHLPNGVRWLTLLGEMMGTVQSRMQHKEDLRNLILSTAWQMVKDEGWQSLSIRKIAEAIKYSVPIIYDHFENKEAIYLEFARSGFELLSKKISRAIQKSNDPVEQIKAIADAYWNFACRNKEYYQLMYGVGMQGCEIEKCFPERKEFRHLVMEPIVAIINKGKNKNVDPCLKYFTFWSILHGLVSIKSMNDNVSDEVNKMVVDDAIAGFIKNLS